MVDCLPEMVIYKPPGFEKLEWCRLPNTDLLEVERPGVGR